MAGGIAKYLAQIRSHDPEDSSATCLQSLPLKPTEPVGHNTAVSTSSLDHNTAVSASSLDHKKASEDNGKLPGRPVGACSHFMF